MSYLRTLFDDATDWRLEEIKLVPLVERWLYVVCFTPPPRHCQDCMTTPFSIIVTMDGNPVAATCVEVETANNCPMSVIGILRQLRDLRVCRPPDPVLFPQCLPKTSHSHEKGQPTKDIENNTYS